MHTKPNRSRKGQKATMKGEVLNEGNTQGKGNKIFTQQIGMLFKRFKMAERVSALEGGK
jgi:hypothetical protein